jgi:hypothetical protein
MDRLLASKPCEVYFAPFDVKLSADQDDDAPTVVQRVVEVYLLGTDGTYRRAGAFRAEDRITATAVPDLSVSLGEVFADER